MTIETLFLLVVTIYLVLIAYGIVGSRKRGAPARTRFIAAALMVVLPPVAILFALRSIQPASIAAGWSLIPWGMLVAGIATAALTEFVARRAGA